MATVKIKITGDPYQPYTTAQINAMTGRSESQIHQMTNGLGTDGTTKLDHCYPFPYSDKPEDAETGKKHIVGNEKLDKFLEFCEKNPLG